MEQMVALFETVYYATPQVPYLYVIIEFLCNYVININTHVRISIRTCRKPGNCEKDVIQQTAYCYVENSFCQTWIHRKIYYEEDGNGK